MPDLPDVVIWSIPAFVLRVAVHEYASIGRDLRSARGLGQRLRYVFAAPNWRPAETPEFVEERAAS